jgi:hypothetical protein
MPERIVIISKFSTRKTDMRTFFHATPLDNFEYILNDGLIPAIGPRSLQIGEEKPGVYAFDCLDKLDDAISGWLGDCFEDEGVMKIAILEISDNENAFRPDGLSHVSDNPLPASAISLVRIEAF